MFVGYPKKTKGGLFYSLESQTVFVSANAIFLEEGYMMEHKSRSRIVLEEMSENLSSQLTPKPNKQVITPQVTILESFN